MNRILVLPIVFILAGCMSAQEAASRQDSADHAECVNFGFEPGTDGYGNCRLELRSIRAQEELARSRRLYGPPPWWLSPYGDPYYDPYRW